jgi:hypothetical protein
MLEPLRYSKGPGTLASPGQAESDGKSIARKMIRREWLLAGLSCRVDQPGSSLLHREQGQSDSSAQAPAGSIRSAICFRLNVKEFRIAAVERDQFLV